MISGKSIRQILCLTIKSKVLILTGTDDEARTIRHEIADFVRKYISSELNVYVHSEGVTVGELNPILVLGLKRWNDSKRAYPFGGIVLVTDPNMSNIKNIANNTKTLFLPTERREQSNVEIY